MQLQKRLSRKVGNREYSKWIITIPPSTIKELGWKEGEKLQTKVSNDKLVVKPYKKRKF